MKGFIVQTTAYTLLARKKCTIKEIVHKFRYLRFFKNVELLINQLYKKL